MKRVLDVLVDFIVGLNSETREDFFAQILSPLGAVS
jgi:hypothetical protein